MKNRIREQDAKKLLQEAGFKVSYKGYHLDVRKQNGTEVRKLKSYNGTVNGNDVVELCAAMGE